LKRRDIRRFRDFGIGVFFHPPLREALLAVSQSATSLSQVPADGIVDNDKQ
jgi:hypothetical protein